MTRLWPDGEPIEVWGETDAPTGFTWAGADHRVVEVCNRWWQPDETVWREYLKVVTGSGLLCLLYHDLIGGGWLLARLYD
ncbi:MAG: hypothetical protein ACOYZ7_00905 [Chloroflexota bacterium]